MSISGQIENEIANGKSSHAYLLISDDLKDIEKAIEIIIRDRKCDQIDITTISPDDETGKRGEIKADQVSELIHEISLSPHGSSRVGIIYSAEKLNESSGNKILKTLEEPPEKVTLILVSGIENIMPTIKSRCRIYRGNLPSENNQEFHTFSYEKIKKETLKDLFKEIEEIVKNNLSETYLSELERFFRQRMIESHSSPLAELIEEAEKTRKKIRQNANPRLSLEALVIKIRRAIL